MGFATVLPDLDFETYSEAGFVWNEAEGKWEGPPGAPQNQKGLSQVGAEPYTAHPTCEILSLSYDLKDGRGKRHWRPGLPEPIDLLSHVERGGLLEAWNVGFERWVWENVCVPRMGWPDVEPEQWRCAMAKARAHALPGALEAAGRVLNLAIQKDKDGARLLKRFSVPQKPTKADPRRRAPTIPDQATMDREWAKIFDPSLKPAALRARQAVLIEDYQDTQRLYRYNDTDIASEAEASSRIPDMEPDELRWWRVHEDINRRGVHIDVESVENCIAVIEQAQARYNSELLALTGIDSASKIQQLVGWLHSRGVHMDGLDEDQVEATLKRADLPPDARRVLEIRAAVGSASVKKVFAMRNRVSADGRLRDLYIFSGARTGRPTGEGPQPTNLPKAGPPVVRCACGHHHAPERSHCPWCGRPVVPPPPGLKDERICEWNPDAAADAIEVLRQRSLAWAEYVMGDGMATIAGAVRALFDAAEGKDLISTDLNSIEAVGLAMLSGEAWRIEVFRTHGKIYEASASMMYRVPLEEFAAHKKRTGQHHPLRQKGKIGELAFGYQGWLGAAQAFGMPGTDEEIKADILAWRRASPAIEWFWGGQTMGKAAGILENAGRGVPGADRWDKTTFLFGVEGMAVAAMSNPGVEYPVARMDGTHSGITFIKRGDALYCRLPSGRHLTYHFPRFEPSERGGVGLSFEGWNSNPKNGPKGWIRMNTWGGRLVENINQATCADVFRFLCIRLEEAGYPLVMHTYDEPVSEVPEGWGSIEEYERLCEIRPSWCADWPIRAPGGYRAKRYRKG
jgi:DNA polymerase